MASYGLLLSRLVPWLLVTSGVLILARFIRDQIERKSPRAARLTFIGIITLAAAGSIVYFARAGLEVSASVAFLDQKWESADRSYAMLTALGGQPSPKMGREWAIARMQMHEWRDCQDVLLRTAPQTPRGPRLSPDSVLMIGQCAFYEGDYKRARAALAAAREARLSFVRLYFLGALTEIEGDRAGAADLYLRSLRENPRFFPALYQAARVLIAMQRHDEAAAIMSEYAGRDPGATQTGAWRSLAAAVARRGQAPPVINFYVLES